MEKFKKLAIIDNIIFFPEHIEKLQNLAESIVWRMTNHGKEDSSIMPETFVNGPACSLEIGYEKPTKSEILNFADDADAILTCWTPISNDLIDVNPNLKYIGFWTNLYSHRINADYAKLKDIHIDYVPDYGTDAVAEFVFAGLMDLARKVHDRYKETRRGKWTYENLKAGAKIIIDPNEIEEWTLRGKKIGIIGLGRIGERVAQIAKYGFSMDVAYFSRTRKPEIEAQGIQYIGIEDLFSWADIISCHLPPDAPEKMINKNLFDRLTPDSIFVNTGSAHAVDEAALVKYLKDKRFMAFLDVYEGLPPRKELKDLPNVLFTYRAAWFTRQSISYKAEELIRKMTHQLTKYEKQKT